MNKHVESLPKVDMSRTVICDVLRPINVISWKDNTNCIWFFAFQFFLKWTNLRLPVTVQKPSVSALGGRASPPDPLTRGSTPGPRWGLRPQTPIIGASHLYLGASNFLTPALRDAKRSAVASRRCDLSPNRQFQSVRHRHSRVSADLMNPAGGKSTSSMPLVGRWPHTMISYPRQDENWVEIYGG